MEKETALLCTCGSLVAGLGLLAEGCPHPRQAAGERTQSWPSPPRCLSGASVPRKGAS